MALVACTAAVAATLSFAPARAQTSSPDPYASAVFASAPTSYWRLGDAGLVAVDELGLNPGSLISGVVTGEPGILPASPNTAMRFDGVDDHVALGTSASLQPGLFTVEAWFRSFGQTAAAGYLGRWRPFGWEAAVDTRGRAFGSVYGLSGTQYVARSVQAFDDGLWHHYALTRDTTSLVLYVDGVARSSVAITEPSRYGTGGAAIGRQGNFNCCYFNGVIDEFALYHHAVTTLEVQDHYCTGGGNAPFCNHPPSADAGDDLQVAEGSTVTLDGTGSSDPDGDLLTYAWELVDSTGPTVTLSSSTVAQPTFSTPDDGSYQFALTTSDGQETSTDDVEVTVKNALPGADVVVAAGSQPRSVSSTTTVTDPGPLDTLTVLYDWGDGSPTETIAVPTPGSGSVDVDHVFAHAGTFTLTVRVTDDDGGQVVRTSVVEVTDPVPAALPSLWANATGDGAALELVGSDFEVAGLAHSNAGIRVGGDGVRLLGGTEYGSALVVRGQHHVLDARAERVQPDAPPIEHAIERYRPGAVVARAGGNSFHDVTAACRSGGWQPAQPLAPGIYYAPCDVRLSGRVLGGAAVTIAAEGEIVLQTAGAASFRPFADDVLLVSGAASRRAIQVTGAAAHIDGWLLAMRGTIQVHGSGLEFACGLLADSIGIDGARLRFHRSSCR